MEIIANTATGNYNISDWNFPFFFEYNDEVYKIDWWQCADGENNSDYHMRLSIYFENKEIYSSATDTITIQDVIDVIGEYLKSIKENQ